MCTYQVPDPARILLLVSSPMQTSITLGSSSLAGEQECSHDVPVACGSSRVADLLRSCGASLKAEFCRVGSHLDALCCPHKHSTDPEVPPDPCSLCSISRSSSPARWGRSRAWDMLLLPRTETRSEEQMMVVLFSLLTANCSQ